MPSYPTFMPPMYLPQFMGFPGNNMNSFGAGSGGDSMSAVIPAILICIIAAAFALWYKEKVPPKLVSVLGPWASGPTVPPTEADALI
jgi:hypothetical protein